MPIGRVRIGDDDDNYLDIMSHGTGFYLPVAATVVNSDGSIDALRHTRGALDVYIQDQTTFVQDLYLHQNKGTFFMQNSASIDDFTLDVTSHNVSTYDILCLKEESRYYQGQVLTFNNTQIGIDTPLDYAFTTSVDMHHGEHDLGVDGSATPQTYNVAPPSGTNWDIVRIMVYIEDPRTMNDGLFGGGDALTKGVYLRMKNSEHKNIFNVKTNGELAQRAYDRQYDTTQGPSGNDTVIVRRTFGGQSKNGVVIRLDGSTGDELQAVVQDDCNSLTHFHIIAQGHVVE